MQKNHENVSFLYPGGYDSPIGKIVLASDGENLTGLWFEAQKYFGMTLHASIIEDNLPVFDEVKRWLDIYFAGKEPDFRPLLAPMGSEFRQRVWKHLLEIPYGKTTTYGELAKKVAKEMNRRSMSAQAMGGAVGHNPISIIIPCHRLLGADGSLTGYAGGVDKKVFLLELEAKKPFENL